MTDRRGRPSQIVTGALVQYSEGVPQLRGEYARALNVPQKGR